MKSYNRMSILIAEDDDGHAELIKHGLKNSGICNELVRFQDGQELWDYLNGNLENESLDPDTHCLVLLDINMPRMNGIEVLAKMKNDEKLKAIPVIMLTTTDDEREIEKCYSLGCSVYITKPIDFTAFADRLKRLGLFLQIVSI